MMRVLAAKHNEYQFAYLNSGLFPNVILKYGSYLANLFLLQFAERKFGLNELPSYVIFNGKEEWQIHTSAPTFSHLSIRYFKDGKSNQNVEQVEAFFEAAQKGHSHAFEIEQPIEGLF